MIQPNEVEHERAVIAATRARQCRAASADLKKAGLLASSEWMHNKTLGYERTVVHYANQAIYTATP